jgi:hypothetical protein
MANPSLSSFVNNSQFQTLDSKNPLLTGFIAGSSYVAPTFNGDAGAASADVGGLFGWLIYARSAKYSPAIGNTYDTYIVYNTPSSIVADLNQLGGVTYCLVSETGQGGTFGFFKNYSNKLVPYTPGTDFLHAVNYLAYGGTLVIAGTCAGLNNYENDYNVSLDVLLGTTANASLCNYVKNKPYITGIFPTISSGGQDGAGNTMPNFDAFVPGTSLVAGSTFANRVFVTKGVKTVTDLSTESVAKNSKITYQIPAVADVAGAFTSAKSQNLMFVSVAGIDKSTIINGTITNTVDWTDTTTKDLLRKNRVNFYVNYNPPFLGQDLVGATAGTSTTISVDERVGPAKLKTDITRDVTNIGLKYLFKVNNASTRSNVVAEITVYLEKYATYLDKTGTQIICDSTNNQDNSTSLNISVVVKPILSTESLSIDVNLQA